MSWELRKVKLKELREPKSKARSRFPAHKLEDFEDSIRECGILEPVVAFRDRGGNLWLGDGSMRRETGLKLGIKESLAIIRPGDGVDALLFSIKSYVRGEMDWESLANACAELKKLTGWSNAEISKKTGIPLAKLTMLLKALELELEVREKVTKGEVRGGYRSAYALTRIEDPKLRESAARVAAERGWSRDELTNFVRRVVEMRDKGEPEVEAFNRALQDVTLSWKVSCYLCRHEVSVDYVRQPLVCLDCWAVLEELVTKYGDIENVAKALEGEGKRQEG